MSFSEGRKPWEPVGVPGCQSEIADNLQSLAKPRLSFHDPFHLSMNEEPEVAGTKHQRVLAGLPHLANSNSLMRDEHFTDKRLKPLLRAQACPSVLRKQAQAV